MNKQIITIIGMILLISSASAITIIAGDSYSFESEEFEYYTAVGNSSNMDGMDVTWEDGITTLSFNLLFKPDTFSLFFFNEKEVIKEVYVGGGGGGGSRTIYKDRNITKYLDREVEKIVEKIVENNNTEEIDGYVDLVNKAAKREHFWKIFNFILLSILVIYILIKIKKMIWKKDIELQEEFIN